MCEPEDGFIFPDAEKLSLSKNSFGKEDATLFDALNELSKVGFGIDSR